MDQDQSVDASKNPKQVALDNVPVTPSIHDSSRSGRTPTVTSHGSDSYFPKMSSPIIAETIITSPQPMDDGPESPSAATYGVTSGREILRRMSLAGPRKQRRDSLIDQDPRQAFSDLNLSGSIISCNFTIPYSVVYKDGAHWVRNLRMITNCVHSANTLSRN